MNIGLDGDGDGDGDGSGQHTQQDKKMGNKLNYCPVCGWKVIEDDIKFCMNCSMRFDLVRSAIRKHFNSGNPS